MITPKMLDAWFRLVTEAMGGSSEAQEAFKLLTGASASQDDLMRWMGRFMPAVAAAGMAAHPQTEVFGDWVEQWWKVMGVVPRYRYLELLERSEDLRRRLEECEKSRKRVSVAAPTAEEAQKAINLWGSMMDESLKMQSEWMRRFLPGDQTVAEAGTGTEGETTEGKDA